MFHLKRFLRNFITGTALSIIALLCSFKLVSAENEFSTSLINTQTVDLKGNTHVEKKFTIKNNLSTVFIKKYGLEINSNKLTNIVVKDRGTVIQANIVKTDTSTTIGIDFPEEIVGKDKERTFTIEYNDPDAAIISGNVLEVYSPKVADPSNFDEYAAILKIPTKFGLPTIANPAKYTLVSNEEFNILNFDREGESDGISLIFGERQFFDFSLDYYLKNPTSNRGIMQVALPPDTAYQKAQYNDIQPRPEKIESDQDGNWIATYLLEPDQTMKVNAKGVTTIYLEPRVDIPKTVVDERYTQSDVYWEVDDPVIQGLAQKYKTPHQIFNYVVDTLSYNYSRIDANTQRLGAKATLEDEDNAVCQEFTDVFIALARANNIPARQATGYAFTNNPQIRPLSLVKDVLHAWPEYFDNDKQQWIPVDPTWTNTTGGIDYFNHLDFSHFVFAYQGVSSEKPYPAGSYKTSEDEDKSIFINVTDQAPEVTQAIDIQVQEPFTSVFNLLGKHKLIITNTTGSAWYEIPVTIQQTPTATITVDTQSIDRLLPYQSIEIPFSVIGEQWIQTQTIPLTIGVGNRSITKLVKTSTKLQQFNIAPEYIAYFCGSFVLTTVFVFGMFYLIKKLRKK